MVGRLLNQNVDLLFDFLTLGHLDCWLRSTNKLLLLLDRRWLILRELHTAQLVLNPTDHDFSDCVELFLTVFLFLVLHESDQLHVFNMS